MNLPTAPQPSYRPPLTKDEADALRYWATAPLKLTLAECELAARRGELRDRPPEEWELERVRPR